MYLTKLDTSALAWSPANASGMSMKMLYKDESTGGMTGEVDTDHGAVATVGSTEGVVWKEMGVSTKMCS